MRSPRTRHPTSEQVEGALQTFRVVHPTPEVPEHEPGGDRATAPLEPSPTAAYNGNNDPLLDCRAASDYLGLTRAVKHGSQAVRSLARKRRLRSCRVAGKIMIRESWLREYIESTTREPVGLGTGDRVP
ncbi:MAG: hypothetical protein V2A79_00245 [Planctomycetota bacterium]